MAPLCLWESGDLNMHRLGLILYFVKITGFNREAKFTSSDVDAVKLRFSFGWIMVFRGIVHQKLVPFDSRTFVHVHLIY